MTSSVQESASPMMGYRGHGLNMMRGRRGDDRYRVYVDLCGWAESTTSLVENPVSSSPSAQLETNLSKDLQVMYLSLASL